MSVSSDTSTPGVKLTYDKNNELTGAIGVFQDITAPLEKKINDKTIHLQEKNDQLQRSEDRYHKMVEEVEDYAR